MTVSRPAGLQAGAEVRLGGRVLAVTFVTATSVQLSDVTGQVSEIPLAAVLGDPSLEVVTRPCAPLPPSGGLEMLPEELLEQARWWERHITEVLTGHPPDRGPGEGGVRPGGHHTLQWLRLAYERQGLWGWSTAGPPGAPR